MQNEPKKLEAKPKPNLLLDSPVRSGQAISNEGDVTYWVFGRFRRGDCRRWVHPCLWGASRSCDGGFQRQRCNSEKIEAELLGINGYYQTAEDIDVALRNRPAQA